MTLIHFLADSEPEPLCRAPEARSWLWTTSPDRVTCTSCSALLRSPRAAPNRVTAAPVTRATPDRRADREAPAGDPLLPAVHGAGHE